MLVSSSPFQIIFDENKKAIGVEFVTNGRVN